MGRILRNYGKKGFLILIHISIISIPKLVLRTGFSWVSIWVALRKTTTIFLEQIRWQIKTEWRQISKNILRNINPNPLAPQETDSSHRPGFSKTNQSAKHGLNTS